MMLWRDLIHLAISAVIAHRLRSMLTALGIAVGIAAVVMLTAIGSGIHQFVLSEFTQFGTNLISITPGKVTTHGGSVGAFGTDRPLTIEDAQALQRITDIVATEPVMAGNAVVKSNGRERRTNVYGVDPLFPDVFTIGVASGRFLPCFVFGDVRKGFRTAQLKGDLTPRRLAQRRAIFAAAPPDRVELRADEDGRHYC